MLKKNSIDIKIEELDSWFAVCGYILPRTEPELLAFNKLHKDFEFKLTGNELDANKIWDGIQQTSIANVKVKELDFSSMRMAARGVNTVPSNVLEKMKKNQKDFDDAE